MTTYANTLGKCYNQTADGSYRLYKVDGMFAIYIVGKEFLDIDEVNNVIIYGDKLEATFAGYLSDPNNFEFGVAEVKAEAASYAENF
jgi:hypothetical protein